MCHDKVTILLCATFAVTFMRKDNPMIEQRQEHTPLNFVSDQKKNLAQREEAVVQRSRLAATTGP